MRTPYSDTNIVRAMNRNIPSELHNLPNAITWWNDLNLVISRINGSVSIHAVDSDLLPVTEPEWFQPVPNITTANQPMILGIDCRVTITPAGEVRVRT